MAEAGIVVFGAGAVGSYLGARLEASSASASKVTLVGRERFVEAVRSRGLLLRDVSGDVTTQPIVAESFHHLSPADLIILAVRGYDVSAAIPSLRTIASNTSMILAMQNGVGSEDLLVEAFGPERILVGTITTSVSMDEPGIVIRNGKKGNLALSSASRQEVPHWVVERFEAAGLPPELVPDYRSLRWSKLLLNLPGTATTAILDCDMQSAMNNPSLFSLERLAFREAVRVVEAQDIPIVGLPGYSAPLMRGVMRLPPFIAQRLIAPRLVRSRGRRAPGMRADLKKGKTEIDFLNGAVARAGERNALETPVNAAFAELIRAFARRADLQDEFREQPAALLRYVAERGAHL